MDMKLEFEWNEKKNSENLKKHGIDFFTAVKVFDDKNYVELFDETHSADEDRYVILGVADDVTVVLQVVYTPRKNGKIIPIISARTATNGERRLYYGEI